MAVDLSPILANIIPAKVVMIGAVLAVFAGLVAVATVIAAAKITLGSIGGGRVHLGRHYDSVDWLMKMYDLEKDLRSNKKVNSEDLRAYRTWARELDSPRPRRRRYRR